MIQIDIEMLKSCSECPFNQNNICRLMPSVPAWQKEINECHDRRAEHCPLTYYVEEAALGGCQMNKNVIDVDELIKAFTDKWNREHPVYDDTSGSMTYSEIIEFIRKFSETH